MRAYHLILFLILIGISSCSHDEIVELTQHSTTNTSEDRRFNDQPTALAIANEALGRTISRNNYEMPEFKYVLNTVESRNSSNLPDTLAYIINYPDNNGFVIVSTDNSIFPVLAYSETGNFSLDNENAKENFIDRIGGYISNTQNTFPGTWDKEPIYFSRCVDPKIRIVMGQRSPFDKYVIEENPGCPTGCVAVASALVMTHSKKELTYHGATFYFDSILDAIEAEQKSKPQNSSDNSHPTYTYAQAADSMAKLLYYIGKDVDMWYTTNASFVSDTKAYSLIRELGYNSPSGFTTINLKDIAYYLSDNYIIYVRGYNSEHIGHAWVIDGCTYHGVKYLPTISMDDPYNISDIFVHCDWGWDGASNGYYSGAVFDDFTPEKYFAIEIEN